MVRRGDRVETLTKTIGQKPRVGVVRTVKGDGELIEVEWDDGRTSTVSVAAVLPTTSARRKRARSL